MSEQNATIRNGSVTSYAEAPLCRIGVIVFYKYSMTKFVNCTPHAIKLNDGRVFDPSGSVARVSSSFTDFTDDICTVVYGDLTGVPDAAEDTFYIVSAMV